MRRRWQVAPGVAGTLAAVGLLAACGNTTSDASGASGASGAPTDAVEATTSVAERTTVTVDGTVAGLPPLAVASVGGEDGPEALQLSFVDPASGEQTVVQEIPDVSVFDSFAVGQDGSVVVGALGEDAPRLHQPDGTSLEHPWDGTSHGAVAVSPDGQRYGFTSCNGATCGVGVADITDGQAVVLDATFSFAGFGRTPLRWADEDMWTVGNLNDPNDRCRQCIKVALIRHPVDGSPAEEVLDLEAFMADDVAVSQFVDNPTLTHFDVSADGSAVVLSLVSEQGRAPTIVDVETGEVTDLATDGRPGVRPFFSPDGSFVVYQGTEHDLRGFQEPWDPHDVEELWIVPVSGDDGTAVGELDGTTNLIGWPGGTER